MERMWRVILDTWDIIGDKSSGGTVVLWVFTGTVGICFEFTCKEEMWCVCGGVCVGGVWVVERLLDAVEGCVL